MPYYDSKKKRWIGQVRIRYTKHRKEFLTKSEAKQWEVEKKQQLKRRPRTTASNPALEIHTISLLELANRYLDYSAVKHSTKTYKEKKLAFRNLFQSISPDTDVTKLHKGIVLDHFKRQSIARSGYAANKDRKNLVAAWNWAIDYIENFPESNPFKTLRFSEIRKPRYIPPLEDFWKVYNAAESRQDQLMLLCYLHLAARRNEIFTLRWEDINFKDKIIRLYTRKRRDGSLEYDWLPLTDQLYNELKAYNKEKPDEEWVFPNPQNGIPYVTRLKWMRRICAAAGVKPFGLHSIRHLTASILVANNISLVETQQILRHKNLTTTQRYIHNLRQLRHSISCLPNPE